MDSPPQRLQTSQTLSRLLRDERGLGTIELIVLLVLIVALSVSLWNFFGNDVALGTNQIDFVQAVLLRTYRDQMAEVNHVHVEGELDGNAFDLTLMFEVSRPPMSADEAAKLMAD